MMLGNENDNGIASTSNVGIGASTADTVESNPRVKNDVEPEEISIKSKNLDRVDSNASLNETFLLKAENEIVTEAMVAEEKRMLEKDEKERLEQAANEEFDEHIAQQRMNRLKFLLTQAGTYSKWLASRLEIRQKEQAEKAARPQPVAEPPAAIPEATMDTTGGESTEPAAETDGSKRRSSRRVSTNEKRKDPPTSDRSTRSSKRAKGKASDDLITDAAKVDAAQLKKSAVPSGPRSHRQPNLVTGCTMREYQLVGMEWLISLWEQGLNGILADEMGLGKTLQTIAFLAHLVEMGVWGPFLVVTPLSTLANWVSEVQRFTPTLKVVLYHGTPGERADIRKNKMSVLGTGFPIVVTSYEIAMNDRKFLQKIKWKYIIVDEGHRLKNMNCRLIKELKMYSSANRLILSGTPLQNNLAELWSLLNFLMPDIFENIEDFESWFNFEELKDDDNSTKLLDKPATASIVSSLHEILKPFLLRRIKTEVEVDLPKKKEYLLFAPLMPKQKELYDACVRGINSLRDLLTQKLEDRQKKESTEQEGAEDSVEANNEPVEANAESSKMQVEAKVAEVDKMVEDEEVAADEDKDGEDAVSRRKSVRLRNSISYKENVSDNDYFDMLERRAEEDALNDEKPKPALGSEKTAGQIVGNQKLQNLIMQLRKVCNHPHLFDVPTNDDDDNYNRATQTIKSQRKGEKSSELAVRLPDIVACSGKMLMLERMLPALFERGHKVLIFSQMTKMLDIIADWLEFVKKWHFCRIDGNVSIETRREQIAEFNNNPEIKLFLLTTRAGGLGINLTAADTVIIYDSDWNPQMDLQAQDRVHRIGQTKPVIIYRLVTNGTVEKRILDRAASKRKLEKLVIHQSHFKGSSRYYQSNKKVADLAELASILSSDDRESVTVGDVDPGNADSDMILLDRVISSYELERILDRTPESFEKKVSAGPGGAGAADANTEGNEDGGTGHVRFKEVDEARDEGNDLLASTNME
ncbi:hypothetical protein HDU76_010850 [Blyttiomyces sp. JEL0837]|nr:hypothetical protein HDU76_010850 [Blyttiomyces sp. JEL0837]